MARAHLVLIRKDIEGNNLQVLDLQPNSSQFVPAYQPGSQSGYISFTAQHDTVAYTVSGGKDTTTAEYKGLAAYMIDNVKDEDNGNIVLTAARANTISNGILTAAVAGTALTAAAINTLIQTATGAGVSTLTANTGTVQGVLRILAGECYLVPSGSVISGAGAGGHAWAGTVRGSFVASTSTAYRGVRTTIDTGSLHLSASAGNLSQLISATYSFNNPSKVYGAGGTAFFLDATEIPATYLGAAVRVYDATGVAITG